MSIFLRSQSATHTKILFTSLPATPTTQVKGTLGMLFNNDKQKSMRNFMGLSASHLSGKLFNDLSYIYWVQYKIKLLCWQEKKGCV